MVWVPGKFKDKLRDEMVKQRSSGLSPPFIGWEHVLQLCWVGTKHCGWHCGRIDGETDPCPQGGQGTGLSGQKPRAFPFLSGESGAVGKSGHAGGWLTDNWPTVSSTQPSRDLGPHCHLSVPHHSLKRGHSGTQVSRPMSGLVELL